MTPRTGRLPHPTREDLPPEARKIYDAIAGSRSANSTVVDGEGRLVGPFNAMVHASPPMGDALQRLGAAIRYEGVLPDRARELAILTVAAGRGSEFEWFAHTGPGAAAGLSDDTLESIARGDGGFFDRPDAVVHRAVTELLAGDLSQQAWDDAVDLLTERGVVDLTVLVGYYSTLATMLRAFRVPLPDDADPAW